MRILSLLAALPAVALAAYLWLAPGYIGLDIPVARHQGGGEFWWELHRTKLAYADSAGVLYVQRQVGTAYPDPHGWKTAAEVLNFFDERLRERGWEKAWVSTDDPSAPETRLLPEQNYRNYYRPQDKHPAPRVIVAVWPIKGGIVDGFNDALTTSNPSLLMQIATGFD
jgi:hypothetical protein